MSDRAKEIRERLVGVSERPWRWERWKGIYRVEADSGYEVCRNDRRPAPDGECAAEDAPNFTLIAHAPADLAWLLGEVERLRGVLRDVLKATHDETLPAPARAGVAHALAAVALGEEPTP
jgi:hypothetical protein